LSAFGAGSWYPFQIDPHHDVDVDATFVRQIYHEVPLVIGVHMIAPSTMIALASGNLGMVAAVEAFTGHVGACQVGMGRVE
jgi:hypothetical protein